MTLFFDLTTSNDRKKDLKHCVNELKRGYKCIYLYEQDLSYFIYIPESPFVYRVPQSILSTAAKGYTLANYSVLSYQGVGASTKFHRLWWEVEPKSIGLHKKWAPMVHGTSFSPFYKETTHLFKWENNGREAKTDVITRYPYLKGNYGFKIQAEEYYGKDGVSFGKRTSNFSAQVMPKGHIFSFEGTAVFSHNSDISYWLLLGFLNSRIVAYWLNQVCAQHKAYNYINSTPFPSLNKEQKRKIERYAKKGYETAVNSIGVKTELTGNRFLLPALIFFSDIPAKLSLVYEKIIKKNYEDFKIIEDAQDNIDDIISSAFGLSEQEKSEITRSIENRNPPYVETIPLKDYAKDFFDWLVGVSFGHFDIRVAQKDQPPPQDFDPFDSLPTCSPGMLVNNHTLTTNNAPLGYPLQLPPYNVLVYDSIIDDDLFQEWDIIQRIRVVLDVLFGDEAPGIESELCQLLGVGSLQTYINRSTSFFKDHLNRYSKSSRKAPIYWPLSIASGYYVVWLYYPSLTTDTLYSVINEHVGPKIAQTEDRLAQLEAKRAQAEGREASRLGKRVSQLTQLLDELKAFRDQLQEVTALPYKPSLDDGVQISAAPLYPLFRHTPWHRELKKTWQALCDGHYDWANLAYAIWPERVREKCQSDKSLAIAHDLEELYTGDES